MITYGSRNTQTWKPWEQDESMDMWVCWLERVKLILISSWDKPYLSAGENHLINLTSYSYFLPHGFSLCYCPSAHTFAHVTLVGVEFMLENDNTWGPFSWVLVFFNLWFSLKLASRLHQQESPCQNLSPRLQSAGFICSNEWKISKLTKSQIADSWMLHLDQQHVAFPEFNGGIFNGIPFNHVHSRFSFSAKTL